MEQQFFTIRIERQETRMERLERRKRETRKVFSPPCLPSSRRQPCSPHWRPQSR